jgi:hypothetical protein
MPEGWLKPDQSLIPVAFINLSRKLPRTEDKRKVELSGIFSQPGGLDEVKPPRYFDPFQSRG